MSSKARQRHWLRYALRRSATPDRWAWISIIVSAPTLGWSTYHFFAGSGGLLETVVLLVGLATFMLAVILYLRDQHVLLEQGAKVVEETLSTPLVPVPDIQLDGNYKECDYEILRGKHGFGFWSRAVSRTIFGARVSRMGSQSWTSSRISVRSGKFAGPDEMRRSVGVKIAVEAIRMGKVFRNDEKVRLCSDVFPALWKSGSPIELQKTDYLASRCTNDVSFRKIEARHAGLDHEFEARTEVRYGGTSYFAREDAGALMYRGYADSECSNQLGCSTLAFTSDGYLLLVDQLGGGLESANLIAPSGSGSLDWSDLGPEDAGGDFWEWIETVSCRELREELGLEAASLPLALVMFRRGRLAWMRSIQTRSVPIGFGGFLHRGGKPEFFFLARIGCTLDELRQNSAYASEEKFLSRRCQISGRQKLSSFSAEEVARLVRENMTPRDSFPLEMAFAMLLELCANCPEQIEGFLSAEILM